LRARSREARRSGRACSLDKGLDEKKGTADDVYIDPQAMGFAAQCAESFGQCTAIATEELCQDAAANDLFDCSRCRAGAAADELTARGFALAHRCAAAFDRRCIMAWFGDGTETKRRAPCTSSPATRAALTTGAW
jgi:hypothetical protein